MTLNPSSPKSLALLARQLQLILAPADRLAKSSPPPLLYDYDQFAELLRTSIEGWPTLATSLTGAEWPEFRNALVAFQQSLDQLIEGSLSDSERQNFFQFELNKCRGEILLWLQIPRPAYLRSPRES